MKHVDREILRALVDDDLQSKVVTHCGHNVFEDLDCEFCCGLSQGYEPCKCGDAEPCDDFEPDDDFFSDMLEYLEYEHPDLVANLRP